MDGRSGARSSHPNGGRGLALSTAFEAGRPRPAPSKARGIDEAADEVGPELLTDAQLAERWQLSRGTLANQRSQGRGPSYLKIAGRVRYRRSDIEAFERAGLVELRSAQSDRDRLSRESIELLIRSAGR